MLGFIWNFQPGGIGAYKIFALPRSLALGKLDHECGATIRTSATLAKYSIVSVGQCSSTPEKHE